MKKTKTLTHVVEVFEATMGCAHTHHSFKLNNKRVGDTVCLNLEINDHVDSFMKTEINMQQLASKRGFNLTLEVK